MKKHLKNHFSVVFSSVIWTPSYWASWLYRAKSFHQDMFSIAFLSAKNIISSTLTQYGTLSSRRTSRSTTLRMKGSFISKMMSTFPSWTKMNRSWEILSSSFRTMQSMLFCYAFCSKSIYSKKLWASRTM